MSTRFLDDPTRQVGLLGVTALVCGLVWVIVRWFLNAPRRPDPWDAQVAAELDREDSLPLCHRCLTPHSALEHFCPRCGAAVGACTNLLPYPYLFSIGHTLRIGTDGAYKHSPFIIAGFFLLAVVEYSVLAPVYWFLLIWRFSHPREPGASAETPSPNPPAEEPSNPDR